MGGGELIKGRVKESELSIKYVLSIPSKEL